MFVSDRHSSGLLSSCSPSGPMSRPQWVIVQFLPPRCHRSQAGFCFVAEYQSVFEHRYGVHMVAYNPRTHELRNKVGSHNETVRLSRRPWDDGGSSVERPDADPPDVADLPSRYRSSPAHSRRVRSCNTQPGRWRRDSMAAWWSAWLPLWSRRVRAISLSLGRGLHNDLAVARRSLMDGTNIAEFSPIDYTTTEA
jgi:hypothetical protein